MNNRVLDYREVPVYERGQHDWYVEPGWCWDLLFARESFRGMLWDPCCGCGTGPEGMRRASYLSGAIIATDIVDRGYERLSAVENFFASDRAADCILSNPPYKYAQAFILHALSRARHKVAVLVQQQFPYSQARHSLFTEHPLARLYFFSTRPSMPPGEALQDGSSTATGGKTDYLWMVWERGHVGPPTAHWLKRDLDARDRQSALALGGAA